MADGIIFRSLSGFYYVETDNGLIQCRARGRFRHDKIKPLVGDRVEITITTDSEGIVDKIFPRKNELNRPPVANIDQVIIVISESPPVTDTFIADRLIASAEAAGVEPVICVNKSDLSSENRLFDIYDSSGFVTIKTSTVTGEGIEKLRDVLAGKISAFAGNSGVGKSSILNALAPELSIAVGDVSEKLGRGRHTTRQVGLYKLDNGAILADTPGFAAFDDESSEFLKNDLQNFFRDFAEFIPDCSFTGCSHVKEKGCAVLEAVKEGKIRASRHKSYVKLYEEAKKHNEWEIKK